MESGSFIKKGSDKEKKKLETLRKEVEGSGGGRSQEKSPLEGTDRWKGDSVGSKRKRRR